MTQTLLLTVKDVAAQLGVPASSVYRMVSLRQIEAIRIGSRGIKFRPQAIEQFLRRRTVFAVDDSLLAGVLQCD